MDWHLAFRTGGPQHLYRFTLDDQQDPALRRTARLCRFHSEAEKELFDIAKHLDVDVRELLVSTK